MPESLNRLTGEQYAELQQALLAAYPAPTDLQQMMKIRLNRNLYAIAGGPDQEAVVFALIARAEAEGWVAELIRQARDHRPNNPEMARLASRMLAQPAADTAGGLSEGDAAHPRETPALQELNRLIEGFAQCECMANVEYRNLLRSLLPHDVRMRLNPSNVLVQDVTDLVTTCLKFPGAFEEMVRSVRFREGPTYGRQRLDEVLRSQFPELAPLLN